jgi:hypothetical protein
MMARVRFIGSLVVIALIALVIATRPQKPAVVCVVWTAGDARSAAYAERFVSELQRLSVEAGKAQYLLSCEVGDGITLNYAEGPAKLDEKGTDLLGSVDILVPLCPNAAKEFLARDLCDNATWLVSIPEDLKPIWTEILNADMPDTIRMETSTVPLASALDLIPLTSRDRIWLWLPDSSFEPPKGWTPLKDGTLPAAGQSVVVPAWQSPPDSLRVGVHSVAFEFHGTVGGFVPARRLNKDCGAMCALLVRKFLDSNKRLSSAVMDPVTMADTEAK